MVGSSGLILGSYSILRKPSEGETVVGSASVPSAKYNKAGQVLDHVSLTLNKGEKRGDG